ncbi:hypothetical protein GNI_050390 [Gregarina niphandrodes]|uniref:Uncharacterized protein n=1 Tax=Gregarina niphandrodes TaxID=110365 RepID=A0A023B9K4_GRENI|nr:hypothetical protein GNI_050390 [Gregarina niphandrodes]EZG72880.1 hypothetical protein GNI_050390 [Gregarina niphandrodes]|eukprot:XP_011129739.1 hypothetical protein GNI_050390 [Gregarina niphandrodes]
MDRVVSHAVQHPYTTCLSYGLDSGETIPVCHHELVGASAVLAQAMTKAYAKKKSTSIDALYVLPANNAIGVDLEHNLVVNSLKGDAKVTPVDDDVIAKVKEVSRSKVYDLEDSLNLVEGGCLFSD